MGQLNNELRLYRDAQSQKLALSQWYQIPVWGQMIGHIGGTDEYGYPRSIPYGADKKSYKGTGKPIDVLTDWYNQGGWFMDIPILRPFVEKPIVGDDQAKGKEEDRTWVYKRAAITQVRKPAKVTDGMMGELALNPKRLRQIWDNMRKDFEEYNQRMQAYSPYDAIYRGYDDNLLRTDKLGLSQKSHPNFYVAGYGRVPYNSDNDAYETSIAAQLANLGADDGMSVQTLRNIQYYGNHHLIVPTTAGPYKVKGVAILNDAQMVQLASDPLFEKMHVALIQAEGDKAPLFSGAYQAYLVEGVLILVDTNNPGAWISGDSSYDSSRGTINYGNVNPLANPVHNSDIKLGIYMGANAILCGNIKPLQFRNETDDYENIKGEASVTVVGYNRADQFDHDGFLTAAEAVTNQSSVVFATNSPNNPTWGSAASS